MNINVDKLYTSELIIKDITTGEYKKNYLDKKATMKACMECPNYSKNWACPEFESDVYTCWDEYDNIKLLLTKINFIPEALETKFTMDELTYIVDNSLFKERMNLISKLEKLEEEYNGKYLSAGYCSYCEECSRITGEKCRHPRKCRNSIESLGGLVPDTLEGVFNEKIKWIDVEKGLLPENLSLLMALLY